MHESVRLAARLHIVSMACLPRSIVLADMLRRQGDRAIVRIGVNKAGVQFVSHAWVEVDGCMVGEPEHVSEQFALLKL
ncbi:transglutaminase superfamily protein [Arenicella xantha]|uniref:Transglutaminase superfamily protein n=2 Tax=Arenicella xantha TaxID=644221 RepID=A0A395JHZ9_9GAMM|nr:transglutaminase superfamily protein [Arenicella xantha]